MTRVFSESINRQIALWAGQLWSISWDRWSHCSISLISFSQIKVINSPRWGHLTLSSSVMEKEGFLWALLTLPWIKQEGELRMRPWVSLMTYTQTVLSSTLNDSSQHFKKPFSYSQVSFHLLSVFLLGLLKLWYGENQGEHEWKAESWFKSTSLLVSGEEIIRYSKGNGFIFAEKKQRNRWWFVCTATVFNPFLFKTVSLEIPDTWKAESFRSKDGQRTPVH